MAEPGTTVGSWLLDVIGTQFRRGEDFFPRRRYVEIVGGATIEDDPVRNSTKLTLSGGGAGVPSDRVINGTAPIRINGGGSANLSADLTISVSDATTVAKGVVQLAGDLAGTATAPVTARLNGATVPAAGALTPGRLLQVSAVAALVYAALDLSNGASVTNRLSINNVGFGNADTVLTTNAAGNATQYRKVVNANVDDAAAIAVAKLAAGAEGTFLRTVSGVPTWATVTVGTGGVAPGTDGQIYVTSAGPASGWATAGGDWDGAVTANVVRRLRGAAIGSAAGGLVTGTVLRVTGPSAIDYGAVNLANEAAVAGALAIAHIAPHAAAAILTTNGSLATEWATTIPGGLLPALAGDATGAITSNTVARVRGAAIGTAAGALVPGQSLRVTGVSAADWGPIDLANANAITGLLAVTNLAPVGTNRILIIDGAGVVQWAAGAPGSSTLSGDVTGPNSATVVGRINGATVPVSGGLTTGNVLQVTGPAALSYGPLNLAGGANFITGALPLGNIAQGGALTGHALLWNGSAWAPGIPTVSTGNIAPGALGQILATTTGPATSWVTPAGDWSGAATANVVTGLTGTAGTIAVHGNSFTWDETASPTFAQTTRGSNAAVNNFTFTSQAPFPSATGTNRNSASFLFFVPDPVSGGSWGGYNFAVGDSIMLALARAAGMATTCRLTINDQSVTYRYGATSLMRVVGPTSLITIDVVNGLTWDNNVATPQIYQQAQTADVATVDFLIASQAPFGSATGTNRNSPALILRSPAPAAGGTNGRVALQLGTTDAFAVVAGPKLSVFNGAYTVTSGTAAPSASEVEGSQYARTGGSNGDFYVRRGGAWVSVFTGGIVTGTGDWTGLSSANAVVALTGTAGQVSMKAAELTWIAGISTFGINQAAPPNATTPVGSFVLQLATPHAAAAGAFRNAGIGAFNIPPPTSGGTPGYWIFRVSDNDIFSVRNQELHVHVDGIIFDKDSAASPVIAIERKTADLPTTPLRIRSQDPYLLATTNVTASDIWYEVGSSIGDPPDPGQHRWFVAGTERMRLGRDGLVMQAAISFTAASPGILEIMPLAFASGQGHSIRIEGGEASSLVGNFDGGDVVLFQGTPSGTGRYGDISLSNGTGQQMVSVVDVGSTRFIAGLCGTVTPSNVPGDESNYIRIGDMTAFPTGNPTSGCLIGSFDGNFVWKNESGASFMYEGIFDGASGGAADFVTVWVNGIQRKLQLYFV